MKRLKIFYYIMVFFVATFGIGFLAAGAFGFMKLSNVQGLIAEQNYRSDMITKREDLLASLEKKYALLEEDLKLVDVALPAEKDSSKLVANIDALAKNSGLKLMIIQSAVAGKKPTSSDPSLLQTIKGTYGYEMPLEITVKGGFTNFTGFVKQLESYQRLLNISSVEITKVKEEGVAGDDIEAKLKITAYLVK